jgi:hypothetical protein
MEILLDASAIITVITDEPESQIVDGNCGNITRMQSGIVGEKKWRIRFVMRHFLNFYYRIAKDYYFQKKQNNYFLKQETG